MSHSLRLGFEMLGTSAEAAVILLGDQPTVPPAAIAALLAARGEKPIVATLAEGHLAPPVLIERSHFDVVRRPGVYRPARGPERSSRVGGGNLAPGTDPGRRHHG